MAGLQRGGRVGRTPDESDLTARGGGEQAEEVVGRYVLRSEGGRDNTPEDLLDLKTEAPCES